MGKRIVFCNMAIYRAYALIAGSSVTTVVGVPVTTVLMTEVIISLLKLTAAPTSVNCGRTFAHNWALSDFPSLEGFASPSSLFRA
jgi:hypothetical protein